MITEKEPLNEGECLFGLHDSKLESLDDRLKKLKSMAEIVVDKMNQDLSRFETIKSAKLKNVYYAGGTLCMDVLLNSTLTTYMMNISTETITTVVDEKQTERLMSIGALKFAFSAYRDTKGITDYYKSCYEKSCIRHTHNILLLRRKPELTAAEEDQRIENYAQMFSLECHIKKFTDLLKDNKKWA